MSTFPSSARAITTQTTTAAPFRISRIGSGNHAGVGASTLVRCCGVRRARAAPQHRSPLGIHRFKARRWHHIHGRERDGRS